MSDYPRYMSPNDPKNLNGGGEIDSLVRWVEANLGMDLVDAKWVWTPAEEPTAMVLTVVFGKDNPE